MANKLFDQVQIDAIPSNYFDLTHDVKLTAQMGNLIPCLAMELIPGDDINLSNESLTRFAPLIAPVMHRFDITVHYWFVPNRLIWNGWEEFITSAGSGTPLSAPYFILDNTMTATQKKFADYMGIPPITVGGSAMNINALPFAAYQKIYNEWYRDQNLIPEVPDTLTNGLNLFSDFMNMRRRAYEHDYFTSALPFAQKGNPVDINSALVRLRSDWTSTTDNPAFENAAGVQTAGNVQNTNVGIQVGSDIPMAYNPNESLEVPPTSVNELRIATKLQMFLERLARAGGRYIETILSQFGVRTKDDRLQRPEYIGGSKTPVIISEVLNTTGEDGGLPQGNMAGHAVAVGEGSTSRYYSTEHGWLIGIISIMPKTAYMQGIPRQFLTREATDYAWPLFANLGEQEVKTAEIYAWTPNQLETWGYLPRYTEYKYMPNRVAGDFRTSLSYWTGVRIFANEPALNQDFIEADPADVNRIFAVTDPNVDNLYIQILHKIGAKRKLPFYGTPYL